MANNDLTNVDMDALGAALFSDPANFGVNGGNMVEDRETVSKKYNELTGKAPAKQEQSSSGSQWDDWFAEDSDDDSDEFYTNEVSFDDIKDDIEDPNTDTSDLTNGNEEDDFAAFNDPSEFFNHIPDDEVIFNGMTVGQVKELAKNSSEVSEQHNFIKHHFDQLTNINGLSKSIIGKNMLETQKRIQGYENALNHPGTLSSQKGQLYEGLKFEQSKLAEIERDYAKEEQAAAERKKAAIEYGFFTVDQIQKQKLGQQWNGDRLWNYVVRDCKLPVATLEAIMALPGGEKFADLAIKALDTDIRNKRQDIAAKNIMTKKQTPKSVSTNKGKPVNTDADNSRKNYLLRKEKQVGLTPAERREQYNYLAD